MVTFYNLFFYDYGESKMEMKNKLSNVSNKSCNDCGQIFPGVILVALFATGSH